MIIDLPPKIPQAVIQYVKDHDYIPDEFKNIYSDNVYKYIKRYRNYKGYQVYRLDTRRYGDCVYLNYKNCHIILHNKKETRCVNNEEAYELAEKDFNLSPSHIKPSVIEYVKKYGNIPDKYKDINIYNANDYIIGPDRNYFTQKIVYTKDGYRIYYLDMEYVDRYDKDRCKILFEKTPKFRCATEDEHLEHFTIGLHPQKKPGAIYKYAKNNYYENESKLKKTYDDNPVHGIYLTNRSKNKYHGYYYYFVCYGDQEEENVKKDNCAIILQNDKEIRDATKSEIFEIKSFYLKKYKPSK